MLALAEALRAEGAHPVFLASAETQAALAARGVAAGDLRAPGALAGLRAVVADTLWPGNAAATAARVAEIARAGLPVAVIDSMPPDHFVADPAGPPPDLVITPYLGAEALRDAPAARRWLAGAGYAILGAEYARLRVAATMPDSPRLLVACGGADPGGLAPAIVAHLGARGWPRGPGGALGVDVVIGPLFRAADVARLRDAARSQPALRLHTAPPGLAPLIAQASLVVGRMGLIRYEAAALARGGVWLQPSDDYRAYLRGFEQAGLARVFHGTDPGGTAAFLELAAGLAARAAAGHDALEPVFPRQAFARVAADGARRVAQQLVGLV
jgi:spore coat polysaccharide biosynthesis predicted glycosyltransferase SpsG